MSGALQPSPLDRMLTVTFFPDKRAYTKTETNITLRDLAGKIATTTAPSKDLLPWLKLARHGDIRTESSCLRNNANVLTINGVEGDYDGEVITPAQASATLRQAGIAALIYTSPSHTEAKPRWRILCPTSVPLRPDDRAKLVARLNGLFAGALAGESFTLSQAYFFGSVTGNADHTVIKVEGRYIDQADELDEGAIGRGTAKPQADLPRTTAPRQPVTGGVTAYGRAALDRACQAIMSAPDGAKHHTVNKEAYCIGGLVSARHIAEGDASSALQSSIQAILPYCKDKRAAERTLQHSFQQGMAAPRDVPDREHHDRRDDEELHPAAELIARIEGDADQRKRALEHLHTPEGQADAAERLAQAVKRADHARKQAKPRDLPAQFYDVPGAIGVFADYCNRTATSPQPLMSLAAGIALVGTLAGRKYRTSTDLRTNIYTVGIVDSGGGKDHARKRIKDCIIAAGLPDYFGGETLASGQAMLSSLASHPVKLFQIDEFGDFLDDVLGPKSVAHRKSIATHLKTLYSSAGSIMFGTEYADQQARPRADFHQPHACLYATTTPGQFWSAIEGKSLNDGLMARILLFVSPCNYPDAATGSLEEPPDALVDALKAIAAGAEGHEYYTGNLTGSGAPIKAFTVPNTPDAETAYRALSTEQTVWLRKHEGTYVTAIIARFAENAMKLALVRAISRAPSSPVMQVDDIAWGRGITLHCINTLLREASDNVADSDYERKQNDTLKLIRMFGPITQRDLLKKGFKKIDARERAGILATLIESGDVEEIECAGGKGHGRPTKRYAAINAPDVDDV
jgi:hypothetical protein